ncbi:low-density lipoprotein receptor-related protein 6-like [Mercenaria mercenaria]|uniref:low-density lipoprotein receptor-related protein 6-like n=1 Tax=Mercenaria mercenaria TaxID=6596 RepID=UPI00234E7F85|nr:low-density lipoprotein receptor-related protein 6-like [Mercenaria mercenaria]
MLIGVAFGVFTTCFMTYAYAENAYGDHGIVYTARAVKVDEEYQNIVSVPSTPLEIDNTTEEYPGLNFGFVFRSPMACDIDYHRNELYVYDYFLRGLLLLENYNSSAMKEGITITRQHYGISKENAHIAVDWISHNVYWTDPLMNWIAMQPGGPISDPTLYKVIINIGLELPRAIAVDPLAGYLFWADYGKKSVIERSTLTGDKRTVLVYSRLNQPNSVVADPTEKRIYWTDLQSIDSTTYDGTDRKQVVRADEVTFWDIAIFQNVLITTDVYTFVVTGEDSYSRFYDKTTGEEITEKRISVNRELLFGVCMYHGDNQPAKPEQDRCKTAGCKDICVNEPTKATCLCREGFILDTDGKSCKEQEGQHQRAVVINTGKSLCLLDIRVLSDQHDYAPACFYTGNDSISFFDVNMKSREAYFATGGTINRVYIDKGPDAAYRESYVVTDQSYNVTGLSYDYSRERLYFAVASDPQQLWYIDVKTGIPAFLVQVDTGDFRSLTVVPTQNKAYWLADLNVLQSVDLAGITTAVITNLTLIYHPVTGISYPKHMVHDNKREEFYVLVEGIDGHSDLLGIDYSGNVSSYVASDKDIVDFAIYKEYAVLINKENDKSVIRSGDLGAYTPTFGLPIVDEGTITGVEDISGVKILDARLQPAMPNPCGPSSNNGGCEHVCLTDGTTVECKCRLGFTLHTDGKQCVSTPVYDDFILATDTTYMEVFQIPLDNPNTAIGIRTPAVDRPDGVIYNHQTGEMVWTGTTQAAIWAVNLNGTQERLVANVFGDMYGYADQLALDPSTGNIYYTGNHYYREVLYNSFIAVLNKQGESNVVVWEGHRPRDIELDPAEGLMFWSDYSDTLPVIYSAGMDGSSKQTLHTTDIVWPNGIALDPTVKRIYWTDGYLDQIYYSDYDGKNRQTFKKVESGARMMDLELAGDYLYYVANNNQQVTRVNKNNENDTKLFGPEFGLGKMYGLDVYSSTAPTNTRVNPQCATNNGGCSHFCLPRPGGYSCGCPQNEDLLMDDKTCLRVPRCEMSIPNGDIIENSACIGTEGNTCNYTCNDGYKPRPSIPHLTCDKQMMQGLQNELHWDVQDPCQLITCPDYVDNGVVLGNCSLLPSDVCLYKCYEGFVPDMAMKQILCQSNGTWNYTTSGVTLCTVQTTTTTEKSTESSASKDIGIGVGIGVGVLVLIIIVIVIIVFLIRSGRVSLPLSKKGGTSGSAFENPRYADNSVDLGETNASFGYATLEEDRIPARATNTTYDNIVPKV